MGKKGTALLVVLNLVALISVLYALATRTGRAQVPATRASFSATGITKYYDASAALRRTEAWILAKKPDGSSARATLSRDDHPDQIRTVVNVPAGWRVSIDPLSESVTTYKLTESEKKELSADVPSCPTSDSSTNSTFLGYPTVLDHEQKILGSRQIDEDKWLAPSLNCLALKRSYKVFDSGKLVGQTTEEVVSLSAGAPDPSLFEVPTNYTERSPSEAMAERARRLGQSCPTCANAEETLDKAYSSRHTF